MKTDIDLVVGKTGKLHRPTCRNANASLPRVRIADFEAFDRLPYDKRAYCCLTGTPIYSYRSILLDQSPPAERAYQHGQALLRGDGYTSSFTTTVQGLANAYVATTDEGRLLLRPALSEARRILEEALK